MIDEELNAFLRIDNDNGTSMLIRKSEIVEMYDVVTTEGKKTYISTKKGTNTFKGSIDEILEKAKTMYL